MVCGSSIAERQQLAVDLVVQRVDLIVLVGDRSGRLGVPANERV